MQTSSKLDKQYSAVVLYVAIFSVVLLVWGAGLAGMMFKSMAGNALLISVSSIALMVATIFVLLWFWLDTKITLDALNEVHEQVLGAVSPETAAYLLKLWRKSGVLDIGAGASRHLNVTVQQPEDYTDEPK